MDKLENNNVEMTKKDEGKKPSTPQKLKRIKGSKGVRKISSIWDHLTRNNLRKIHVHHAIIVGNLILVILERVGLVIYGVTCNQNVENLLIE